MKWIKIEEKLPDIHEDVLLLTDSGVIEGYRTDLGDWGFIMLDYHGCGCCSGGSGDKVIAWMELPQTLNI